MLSGKGKIKGWELKRESIVKGRRDGASVCEGAEKGQRKQVESDAAG